MLIIQGDPNSNTRDKSYVDSIPIPRTVDVSTLTVDRCKSDSKGLISLNWKG